MSDRPIADQQQRDRIAHDLDTNLLVEAGAGSGKTYALLDRLVALIRTGKARVDQIAAVTFTRKAAAELAERFQTRLESTLREARQDGRPDAATADEIERMATALHDIEHGFIGTIHAFCARLLRERPIEARLDPAFREVFGPEEERLKLQAWERHLERLTTSGDASLALLRAINLEASWLFPAYRDVVEQPDVVFEADVHDPPDIGDLRQELSGLVDEALALMPEVEPEPKWGRLQSKLRRLRQTRWNDGWSDDAVFLDALEIIVGHNLKPTYKRWGVHGDAIRPIEDRLTRFAEAGGAADAALRQWQAYRYRIVLEFVQGAAAAYADERRRLGVVTFNDLLMETAGLLRNSPSARRDLARRYRYLLVDEFQDTDPIQAEIVFLLTADDPDVDAWHEAEPRPGSLFVVGDPKQSIYRFRRADIGIYNQVKRLFEQRGQVLLLTTNFRSQPPIEEIVNHAFDGPFPAKATEHQAAFAPLEVHKDDEVPRGVFWYEVACNAAAHAAVAAADAPLVASWIKQRVDEGDRTPGDFLLLTRRKDALSFYGEELEKRGIPFQITGSGVDIGEQLGELVILLRALEDPHDRVRTVAALVGLFFGIDHEQLVAHRLAFEAADVHEDRAFAFTTGADDHPEGAVREVVEALARLRGWWWMTLRLPADVVVGAMIDELGLLPYLAAGEAGGSNAGALAYVMNAVRAAGVNGDTSLSTALDALEEALLADDVEAPLQPGRDDVVRVMNLHKAKGLEAKVVILVHPAGQFKHPIKSVVQRPEEGAPHGAFLIAQSSGRFSSTRLAAPLDWDELAAQEEPFETAEQTRLLYVAVTRACQELLISYCEKTTKSSPWEPLYAYREAIGEHLDLRPIAPPERQPLHLAPGEMSGRVDALDTARTRRADPSYQITSVTKMVKHDTSIFAVDAGGLGRAWGNAVHEALEAAQRGASEEIRAICRTALLDNDLPVNADGEPEDLDDLLALIEAVRGSDTWQRAQAAEERLVEAPFALAAKAGESAGETIVEGVIDLAFREADGWVIVDYKTDVVDDADNLAKRREQYKDQVNNYAAYFETITGATVKERQILWVGDGLRVDSW